MLTDRTLIEVVKFADAEDLPKAIKRLVEISGRHPSEVYISAETGGFFRGGYARLYEEILTDYSTVFDIELGE